MRNKLPKIIAGLLATFMLAGILGATVAYAQGPTPPTPPAGQDGGPGPKGGGSHWLGQAGLEAAAGVLGMTSDELTAELQNGKTLEELADEAGVDLQDVQAAISAARAESMREWIEQAVADNSLSQEKADWLLEGLDKGFLDGPGFGFRFGPGPAGPPLESPLSDPSQ